MKRIFDIILSLCFVPVSLVLILVIAVLVRLSSNGPALFNQDDLIALRTERGVHRLIPGITGWAQINGRDDIPIPKKVEFLEDIVFDFVEGYSCGKC